MASSGAQEPWDAQYVHGLEDGNQLLQSQIDEMRIVVNRSRNENAGLQEKIARGIRHNKGRDWNDPVRVAARDTTWQEDILNRGDTVEARKAAYRKSCQAGNMNFEVVHSDLFLIEADEEPTEEEPTFAPATAFPFQRLPTDIQARIFRMWLVQDGPLHCISRMCPFGQVPMATHIEDNYPRRFHWGDDAIPLQSAEQPNNVLRVLSVSKDFFYMGIYAFYGLNDFAFSSIGEMGRFLGGIGPIRRQRVQSIDTYLIGSRMPRATEPYKTAPKPSDANKRQFGCVRTRAYHTISQLRSLTKSDISLNQGNTRRGYEEHGVAIILLLATHGQADLRGLRNMDTVQGMDYFKALRGLQHFSMFHHSDSVRRIPIRNQAYVDYVRSQVYHPKSADDVIAARPHNLKRPFSGDDYDDNNDDDDNSGWRPSEQVREVIDHLLASRHAAGEHGDREHHANGHQHGFGGGNAGDDDSDDSDSSDDDNSNGPGGRSGATPVRYLHGRPNGCAINKQRQQPKFKVEVKQEMLSDSERAVDTEEEADSDDQDDEADQDMDLDDAESTDVAIKYEDNDSNDDLEDEGEESDENEATMKAEDNSTEHRNAMEILDDEENDEDPQLEFDDHANAFDDTEMSGIDQLNAYSGQLASSGSPYSTSSRASSLDEDNDSDMLA